MSVLTKERACMMLVGPTHQGSSNGTNVGLEEPKHTEECCLWSYSSGAHMNSQQLRTYMRPGYRTQAVKISVLDREGLLRSAEMLLAVGARRVMFYLR